ncbi:MAG: FAD-dependent oxidoreductase [Acidobacteria bacterium]|nr:FAD-dependent oxidoreductase [Acidobacteriota bacterium]
MESTPDIVVIGGGPAGLSAAAWCSDLGLSAVLIEGSEQPGGQLHSINNPIANYAGLAAANGREFAAKLLEWEKQFAFRREFGTRVESVSADPLVLRTAGGEEFRPRAVILATGLSRRRLGLAGEDEFVGKGVLRSGAGQREEAPGKHVVIVGGGDAAIENAVLLSEFAERVTVVHRSREFRARAEFLESARSAKNVELITETYVTKILGEERFEGIEVSGPEGPDLIMADLLLIRIGFKPNSELLRGLVELDVSGYVQVDVTCLTSEPMIYACGDVANPVSPTISTATGMGATAAKAIAARLS